MVDVPLEVPLGLLPLGGGWQSSHSHDSGIEILRDPLDHATFPGSISAFEDDHDLEPLRLHPFLKFD